MPRGRWEVREDGEGEGRPSSDSRAGIPKSALDFITSPQKFSNKNAERKPRVCAARSCCSRNLNASHQLIVRFTPSLPLSHRVHARRSAVICVPGSGIYLSSRRWLSDSLSITPSERSWMGGGGGETCSPATAIRPRLHQLIPAFINLLMPSSQPHLNASRAAFLPAAAADAEERRGEESSPLQSQSGEDALLLSASLSLPQSRSPPRAPPPPSVVTVKSQSPNCLVRATNTNAGEAADIYTNTPSTLVGTDPGSCVSE